MERRNVTLGEEVLSVDVRVGRPTVLLLHGLAGYGGEWVPVIQRLPAGVGIVNPDQRGHGATWALGTVRGDRASYVGDVEELIEGFETDPVVVVGQSMGGIVATLLAHKRPDLVAGLVLVEAGMSALTEAELTGLRAWFDRWPKLFADEAEATDFFGVDAPSTGAWVEGLEAGPRGLSRRFDGVALLETMNHLASSSRWREWSEVVAPTTLIRAERSFLDDTDLKRMVAMRPEIEVVEVDDSGHDVHLDKPESVAEVVRSHLNRITATERDRT